MVGRRDAGFASEFLQDVAGRLSNRVQLTTDGHKMYLNAVIDAFADQIDYAQLVKIYGADPEGARTHSPAQCLGIKREFVRAIPTPSTSAPATSNGRISTCGCRTAALLV